MNQLEYNTKIPKSETFFMTKDKFRTHPAYHKAGSALGLYNELRHHSDDKANSVCPGRKRLAKQVGCTEKTIDNRLKKLVALGLISIEHRPKIDGDYQTNIYHFPIEHALLTGKELPHTVNEITPPTVKTFDQTRTNKLESEKLDINILPSLSPSLPESLPKSLPKADYHPSAEDKPHSITMSTPKAAMIAKDFPKPQVVTPKVTRKGQSKVTEGEKIFNRFVKKRLGMDAIVNNLTKHVEPRFRDKVESLIEHFHDDFKDRQFYPKALLDYISNANGIDNTSSFIYNALAEPEKYERIQSDAYANYQAWKRDYADEMKLEAARQSTDSMMKSEISDEQRDKQLDRLANIVTDYKIKAKEIGIEAKPAAMDDQIPRGETIASWCKENGWEINDWYMANAGMTQAEYNAYYIDGDKPIIFPDPLRRRWGWVEEPVRGYKERIDKNRKEAGLTPWDWMNNKPFPAIAGGE